MRIAGRTYTRREIEERAESVAQLGGIRHYELSEGSARGVRAADFRAGTGLQFTVLPDRAMDVSLAAYKGINLSFLSAAGEAHPAFYDASGSEWLRTFFGGLLTTCGLTHVGPPGPDGDALLGLHGRIAHAPARQVRDLSGWEGDEYVMRLQGTIEECALFGDKMRLERTITARVGGRELAIDDTVTNFGFRPAPFAIVYHINPGFPLLDESAELALSAESCEPYDEAARPGMRDRLRFSPPQTEYVEQDYLHTMRAGADGLACAALLNPGLAGGLGLTIRFSRDTLPLLSEWKRLWPGEYVIGLEPCNVKIQNRAALRKAGALPMLAPGESRRMRVEIGVLEGAAELESFRRSVAAR